MMQYKRPSNLFGRKNYRLILYVPRHRIVEHHCKICAARKPRQIFEGPIPSSYHFISGDIVTTLRDSNLNSRKRILWRGESHKNEGYAKTAFLPFFDSRFVLIR